MGARALEEIYAYRERERETARERASVVSGALAKRAFALLLLQRRCHVDFDLVPCVYVCVCFGVAALLSLLCGEFRRQRHTKKN